MIGRHPCIRLTSDFSGLIKDFLRKCCRHGQGRRPTRPTKAPGLVTGEGMVQACGRQKGPIQAYRKSWCSIPGASSRLGWGRLH